MQEFGEDGSRRAASRRRSRARRVSGTQARRDLPDAKASPDLRPVPQSPGPWQAHALRRAPVVNDHGLEIVYRRLPGADCPRPSGTWRLVVTRFRPRPFVQVPFLEEQRRSCIVNGPARETSRHGPQRNATRQPDAPSTTPRHGELFLNFRVALFWCLEV